MRYLDARMGGKYVHNCGKVVVKKGRVQSLEWCFTRNMVLHYIAKYVSDEYFPQQGSNY